MFRFPNFKLPNFKLNWSKTPHRILKGLNIQFSKFKTYRIFNHRLFLFPNFNKLKRISISKRLNFQFPDFAEKTAIFQPEKETRMTFQSCFLAMRTARNIFIATLAVADSTLCLITMPMTLLGILTKYWPFGPQTWLLCKIVRSCPAVTVFFSSYTMAIIALDRHRFIVHSSKRQVCV